MDKKERSKVAIFVSGTAVACDAAALALVALKGFGLVLVPDRWIILAIVAASAIQIAAAWIVFDWVFKHWEE